MLPLNNGESDGEVADAEGEVVRRKTPLPRRDDDSM